MTSSLTAGMTADAPRSGGTFMAMTFELQGERFAVDVATVQEVIDPLAITVVPNADPFAPGLINARGSVVPVLDLPHRLGLPPSERTSETRFVVMDADIGEDRTRFAIVADRRNRDVDLGSQKNHRR